MLLFNSIKLNKFLLNKNICGKWFHSTANNKITQTSCSAINQKNIAADQTNSILNQLNDKIPEFHFKNKWPDNVKIEFTRDMILFEEFINESEEHMLYEEAEKSLRRTPYEYNHWDDAIHGYREMEKRNWLPESQMIINRIMHRAFVGTASPLVHILDLAQDGIIKPHVDSSRYCGNIIAGLSLLSNCIMRLIRVDETAYQQGKDSTDIPNPAATNASQPKTKPEHDYSVDILLKRRSLYIMKDSARYKFTHEVLPSNVPFKDQEIEKNRRISIICRNEP